MKELPAVVASAQRGAAIAIDEFEGVDRAQNRDAFDFAYLARGGPTENPRRLVVRFSGTVMSARTSEFGLPDIDDRQARFGTFSEAAIGDALDELGQFPIALPDGQVQTIECFSPRFQSWLDRPGAKDEAIEHYLRAHVLAAWQFSQPNWRFGASDLLRLKRAWPDCRRIIELYDNQYWTLSEVTERGATLTPRAEFIREWRQRATTPAPVATAAEEPSPLLPTAVGSQPSPAAAFVYVDESRIADLRLIDSADFDFRTLVALCEELNQCYRAQCYHAVAALTRALIDHVPPVFGCRSFAEVANNYPGSRSFRSSMQHLETTARAIADQHLHTRIRKREVLPTRVQVDFSQTVDVLLAEIVRIM